MLEIGKSVLKESLFFVKCSLILAYSLLELQVRKCLLLRRCLSSINYVSAFNLLLTMESIDNVKYYYVRLFVVEMKRYAIAAGKLFECNLVLEFLHRFDFLCWYFYL